MESESLEMDFVLKSSDWRLYNHGFFQMNQIVNDLQSNFIITVKSGANFENLALVSNIISSICRNSIKIDLCRVNAIKNAHLAMIREVDVVSARRVLRRPTISARKCSNLRASAWFGLIARADWSMRRFFFSLSFSFSIHHTAHAHTLLCLLAQLCSWFSYEREI